MADNWVARRFKLLTALTGLAVIVAILVRWYGLASQSLWLDEGFTVWLSQLSPNEIWHGLQTDTSGPPLYFLLQHIWIRWFGTSETSLRGLSAFFETLSLPIFYLLAKKILVDKRAVTMAMWIFALCAFQVEYAREARCYALLLLLSLASVYCAVVFLEKRSTSAFCCLVLSLSAALYTHNMMLFYLPGIALLWLIYPSDLDRRRRLMTGSLCVAIVLLLYSPWLPSLRRQTRLVQRSFWISRPSVGSVVETINTLSGLMQDPWSIGVRWETVAVQFAARYDGLSYLWNARALRYAGGAIFVWCVLGGLLYVVRFDRRKTAALLSYSLVPIALAFVVSRITQPVYLNRAFIATSAIIPILFAAPLAFQSAKWRRPCLVINVIALTAMTISLLGVLRSQKEDWRSVTDYLIRKSSKRGQVLFSGRGGQVLFDYYNTRASHPLPTTMELQNFSGMPIAALSAEQLSALSDEQLSALSDEQLLAPLREAAEAKTYDEIDVVVSHASDRLSERTLEYLGTHCVSVHEASFVGGVRVVRCALPPNRQNAQSAVDTATQR